MNYVIYHLVYNKDTVTQSNTVGEISPPSFFLETGLLCVALAILEHDL